MRIVAIDDEEGALKLVTKAITGAAPQAELETFTEARALLAYAQENKIDVAFLDIQMPDYSGLELAKALKKTNRDVNIIFTTGFDKYAMEAMKLHSSGYLLKPITRSDVENELMNLRCPVKDIKDAAVVVRTFGPFDVFVQGKPLSFQKERAKELMAYLVDRRGATVTRKELASIIFEDREYTRTTQAYLTQVISSLKKTLHKAGLEQLLLLDNNSYALDTSGFSCDAYEYQDGIPAALNSFHGEYMSQYSWAEEEMFKFYE